MTSRLVLLLTEDALLIIFRLLNLREQRNLMDSDPALLVMFFKEYERSRDASIVHKKQKIKMYESVIKKIDPYDNRVIFKDTYPCYSCDGMFAYYYNDEYNHLPIMCRECGMSICRRCCDTDVRIMYNIYDSNDDYICRECIDDIENID